MRNVSYKYFYSIADATRCSATVVFLDRYIRTVGVRICICGRGVYISRIFNDLSLEDFFYNIHTHLLRAFSNTRRHRYYLEALILRYKKHDVSLI